MAALSVESLLAPADKLRRIALRSMGSYAGSWSRDRDARVAILGIVSIVTALATTALVPLWALALGPILLGVPHIVGDVRYLWVRPGHHRRLSLCLAAGLPLLVGAMTSRLAWGFVGAAGALLVARSSLPRRLVGLAITVALFAASMVWRGWAELVFAHAHNAIGVMLWWAWRPRGSRLHWIPLALFAIASIAIVLGALGPALTADTWAPATAPARIYVSSLAPFATPELARNLVLLYAFAQAVHYGVWLRLIPEDDRERRAPRTWASSYRALRAEFGVFPLVVIGALAFALAVWGTRDLAEARFGYLRFAVFHGQLELVAAAILFAEGRRA